MHLFFIRHGESTSNYGELITGQQDAPLTDNGREQAKAAGRAMAAKGLTFDRIVSSSLSRAHDTARIIAQQVGFTENDIEINDLVIERSFGSLEGKPKEEVGTLDDASVQAAGGELDPAIRARAERFLAPLRGKPGTLLVVSHTGFGRRIKAVVENVPTDHTDNFKNADLADLGEI